MNVPTAFMSYARRDDRNGALSELRKKLKAEVEEAFGNEFNIFQDNDSITIGQNWKRQIEESLDDAIFFIPVITPSFFLSDYCRIELQRFLERETKLGRDDLIFPIYYRRAPYLEDEEKRESDEMARAIEAHQYVDWRELRFEDYESVQVRRGVAEIASSICDVLYDLGVELGLESPPNEPVEASPQKRPTQKPSSKAKPSGGSVSLLKPQDSSSESQEELRLITVDRRMIEAHRSLILVKMDEGQEAVDAQHYADAAMLFKEAVDQSLEALKALKRGRRRPEWTGDEEPGELRGVS
jgi:TIR domain